MSYLPVSLIAYLVCFDHISSDPTIMQCS